MDVLLSIHVKQETFYKSLKISRVHETLVHWKGVKYLMSRPFFSNDITHEYLDSPCSIISAMSFDASNVETYDSQKWNVSDPMDDTHCLKQCFYNQLVTISYTLSGVLLLIETSR